MSGSLGSFFFCCPDIKSLTCQFWGVGSTEPSGPSTSIGTSLIVLLYVSIGGRPSPSLTWNLKYAIYIYIRWFPKGISYSFWCHFQVNHVKLWKGIKLVLLNAASFPLPFICLLSSEEFLQWFSVQALFLWRTRGRRGETWAMKASCFGFCNFSNQKHKQI